MENSLSNPRHAAGMALLAAGLATGLILLLRAIGALQGAELAHHDWVSARLAQTSPAPDVALVVIEEEDLAAWGWPLPDAKVAALLRAAHATGPATIGLDIYRDTSVGAGADDLQAAFLESGTIAISKLGPTGGLTVRPPGYLEEPTQFGFSDVPVDTDGVVRRALLLVNDGEALRLSFAMKLAMETLGQSGIAPWPPDPSVLMLSNAPLPPLGTEFGGYRSVDAAGYQVPLRFSYALPVAQTLSARALLAGNGTDILRDRAVIIGLNSESIKDYFRTPLNSGDGPRFTYGTQVHAIAVQHLLDVATGKTDLLRDLPDWGQTALIFSLALGGAFLGILARSGIALVIAVPVVFLLVGATLSYGLARSLWLPTMPAMLAMTAAFLMCFGTLSLMARHQRKVMARLFSDHLSPDLARQVWQSRALFMTGGKPRPQELDTTLIFLDLAGSTAIGGTTPPEDFVRWISRALDALSDVARSHGGFIEKFTGDGLLIAFGAPLKREGPSDLTADAIAACQCALALAKCVETLNAEHHEGPAYRVRMGLHSGMVYGGALGNRGALQYNLVGDTVNVAARIEAYGKRLKDRQNLASLICLSGITLRRCGDVLTAEPVGTLVHDDGVRHIDIFQLKAVE